MDIPELGQEGLLPKIPLVAEWKSMLATLDFGKAQLIGEFRACLKEVEQIHEAHLKVLESFKPEELEFTTLELLEKTVARVSRKVVEEHYEQWEQRKPFKRAMKAVETYERRLEDAARSMPAAVQLTGTALVQILSPHLSETLEKQLLRLGETDRTIDPAALVLEVVRGYFEEFMEVSAPLLTTFAAALRQLRQGWDCCYEFTRSSTKYAEMLEDLNQEWHRLLDEARQSIARAEQVLDEIPKAVATAFASAHTASRRAVVQQTDSALTASQAIITHLVEQFYAVEEEVKLLLGLFLLLKSLKQVFRDSIESVHQERLRCTHELDLALTHITVQQCQTNFQLADTRIIPASMRLGELEGMLRAQVRQLPATVRLQRRLSPNPHSDYRMIDPYTVAMSALQGEDYREYERLLQAVENDHSTAFHQLEQAHDVIEFGLQNSENGQPTEVTREAFQNARSLLEFHRKQLDSSKQPLERVAANLLFKALLNTYPYLRQSSVEAMAESARKGLTQALLLGSRRAIDLLRNLAMTGYRAGKSGFKQFLVYIGWLESKRAVGQTEVTIRPMMPEEFTLDLHSKEMPAIYKRLFQFEPVKDPKFLTGREQEMEAMAKAREVWQAGRPASLLIVGERGSGKSSLINCAVQRMFSDDKLLRLEFSERMVLEEQLERYFCRATGVEGPEDLQQYLTSERRVIIVEELERAFLRQIGHFDAVRALIRLIHATCRQTLWILAVNQVAFKFLDAVVGLGQIFSHRIDAARAGEEALRQAILVRHKLSGLRLQFAPPPEARKGRAEGQISWLHKPIDAENIFFNSLARESNGIFRTAFEIWLSHIERIEGGICYLKPIIHRDLTPITDYLQRSDLFSLVAVMQHGSLTPDEHSKVFCQTRAESRSALDRLQAFELIEPDPLHPGYRVRPEAIRLVRQALYVRNLL